MSVQENGWDEPKNDKCTRCNQTFDMLGNHWAYSDCGYPKVSDEVRHILSGLLMSDGSLGDASKNNRLSIETTNLEYLKHLSSELGNIVASLRKSATASEAARQARDGGLNPKAREENYSDRYRLNTRCHPMLNRFDKWYDCGEKVWPQNLELFPRVLKHWYCGDGTLAKADRIQISMLNEKGNKGKIESYFERVGLPSPSSWNIYEREDNSDGFVARWGQKPSKELFSYMGEPAPGFGYKWPDENE